MTGIRAIAYVAAGMAFMPFQAIYNSFGIGRMLNSKRDVPKPKTTRLFQRSKNWKIKTPHQGEAEAARRRRQLDRGIIQLNKYYVKGQALNRI